jgi:hypothetical protein
MKKRILKFQINDTGVIPEAIESAHLLRVSSSTSTRWPPTLNDIRTAFLAINVQLENKVKVFQVRNVTP